MPEFHMTMFDATIYYSAAGYMIRPSFVSEPPRLFLDYYPPVVSPIVDGVTLQIGNESQRSDTDSHGFHVRIPHLDHWGDIHPGE